MDLWELEDGGVLQIWNYFVFLEQRISADIDARAAIIGLFYSISDSPQVIGRQNFHICYRSGGRNPKMCHQLVNVQNALADSVLCGCWYDHCMHCLDASVHELNCPKSLQFTLFTNSARFGI